MRTERDAREVTRCRSCERPIYWGVWPTGKKMPIDADPVTTGKLVVTYSPASNTLRLEQFNPNDVKHTHNRRRFDSHFATCPDAQKHRRPTE